MVKQKRISKQLFYKHARFLNSSPLTLQDQFSKAIHALPIANREEQIGGLGESAGWMRLVNSPRQYAGFSFGVMVLYSPGIHHMVIEVAAADGKDELDVSKLPPPAGKQFMETPLYFAIRDNHVVFIQSKSLRVRDLEEHLNWLCTKAGVQADEERLELSDAIPEATRKRIEKAPVQKIRIGMPLVEEPATPPTLGDKVSSAVSKVASGLGINALKGLLTETEYAGLKLDDLTEVPNIEVSLEIKVTGRRRSTKKAAKLEDKASKETEIMGGLMRELRHVDDASFLQVETRGGGKVLNGNDLRVQDTRSVASYDGVLDTSDAFEIMRTYLETLVDSGTIAAGD